MGEWKIVSSVQSITAGWTAPEFPYSSGPRAEWRDAVTAGEPYRCARAFCLFDLSADPEEKHDLATAHGGVYESLTARYAELQKGVHQSRYFDPAESNCKPLAAVLDDNSGYIGPVCSR